MQNSTEMGIYRMRGACVLVVQVLDERERFNPTAHARLFVSFTRGGHCSRGIAIDPAFGKRPSPGAGAHQKKFDPTIGLPTITDSRNHHASAGWPGRELPPFRKIDRG